MFINISSQSDNYLSRRLHKPLNEKYDKTFGKRRVYGSYQLRDDDVLFYNLFVEHDYIDFINSATSNWHSYLNHRLNSVTPYQLLGAALSLNQSLRKKYSSTMEEYFMDYNDYTITIGPFAKSSNNIHNFLINIAEELGITLSLVKETDNIYVLSFHSDAYQFNDFLQKVFVLSFALVSSYDDLFDINKDALSYITRYGPNVVNDLKTPLFKRWLIHRLTKYKREFTTMFDYDYATKPKVTINTEQHKTILAAINEIVLGYDISTILDLGCGDGRLDYYIKYANPKINVLGIDKSDYQINRARRLKPKSFDGKSIDNGLYSGLNFKKGNLLYPIMIGQQDVVILSNVVNTLSVEDQNLLSFRLKTYYKPKFIITTEPIHIHFRYYDLLELDNSVYVFRIKYMVDNQWTNTTSNLSEFDARLINNGLCSDRFNPNMPFIGEVFAPSQQADSIYLENMSNSIRDFDNPIIEEQIDGDRYIFEYKRNESLLAFNNETGQPFVDLSLLNQLFDDLNTNLPSNIQHLLFDTIITPWQNKNLMREYGAAIECALADYIIKESLEPTNQRHKTRLIDTNLAYSIYNRMTKQQQLEIVVFDLLKINYVSAYPYLKSAINEQIDILFAKTNIFRPILWIKEELINVMYTHIYDNNINGVIIRENNNPIMTRKARRFDYLRFQFGLHYASFLNKVPNKGVIAAIGLSMCQCELKLKTVDAASKSEKIILISKAIGLEQNTISNKPKVI